MSETLGRSIGYNATRAERYTLCAVKTRHYYYGRPLSVSGRPCYILPMFFIYLFIFYGRLIFRPWLTEVRESFTRSGP